MRRARRINHKNSSIAHKADSNAIPEITFTISYRNRVHLASLYHSHSRCEHCLSSQHRGHDIKVKAGHCGCGHRCSVQKSTPADKVINASLNSVKAHGAALFALQVVDQRSESLKVLPARSVETVIQRLLVYTTPNNSCQHSTRSPNVFFVWFGDSKRRERKKTYEPATQGAGSTHASWRSRDGKSSIRKRARSMPDRSPRRSLIYRSNRSFSW